MMADRAFQRLGAVNWLVSTTRSGQSRAIYVVQTARRVNHGPISAGYPGNVGQYAQTRPDNLYRSVWFLEKPLAFNLENVCIDGRVFSSLTGRSAVGGSFS